MAVQLNDRTWQMPLPDHRGLRHHRRHQGFTHLALIRSAVNLAKAAGSWKSPPSKANFWTGRQSMTGAPARKTPTIATCSFVAAIA